MFPFFFAEDFYGTGTLLYKRELLQGKNAGLDYRYVLVINDDRYIEVQTQCKIPKSQYRKIKNDLERIKKEFQIYLNGYIKTVRKKRNQKEPLYKESSLINYLSELGDCQIHK